ncbi:MAG: T9SS type A sorting domain-containing protein [Bacteroidales bacterium]|nr:T9SS type A sorting domain-containing protein [Bacteroidales bacterium]
MKKTSMIFAFMFLLFGTLQAQDIYFAGNGNGMGKVWKNDSLVYGISDTIPVQLTAMRIAFDSSVFIAGQAFDSSFSQGRVWLNDSCIFAVEGNSVFHRMLIDSTSWTAAGYYTNAMGYTSASVWQNGNLIHASTDSVNSFAFALAMNDTDLYYAGSVMIDDSLGIEEATVWKNDTMLWQYDNGSRIADLCHDGANLYAAGYYVLEGLTGAALWQNDSLCFSVGDLENDAMFTALEIYEGDIYLAGRHGDTLTVWKNGEVLYQHPFIGTNSSIKTLVINEFGVYYAGQIYGDGTVWKDGEILYQPDDCECVSALCVRPTPPSPTYTLTVMANDTLWGSVSGSGLFHYGDTATIAAMANPGFEFLYWNDSITNNPRDILITQDTSFIAYFGQIDYLIESRVSPEEAGSVTEGGIYHYGDTLTLEATANLGFVFVGWNDSITDNPRDIIVLSDSTFTAIFDTLRCSVITEVTPEGAGSVEGGGEYDYGTSLFLIATSNTGYVFSQWNDGVADNPREVMVKSDTVFTAQFTPIPYEITTAASPEHGGIVEGAGIYDYGDTAILAATPNEYFMFLCWSDGSTSNPRHVVVRQDATYTALFRQNGTPEYTLTVVANSPMLGEVTGSGIYPEGATVEISATPAFNALFEGWDDGNTDNPRSVTITQDMSITAIFSLLPSYNIVVESNNPELGSVYGGGLYFVNSVITIGATPNEGYHFAGWQDGDMNNPRTITVTEDATYTAIFSENPVSTFTITVYHDESQGFILGAGTYVEGSTATLAAIPSDDYMFVKWSDGVTDNPREITVTQDLVLAAFFNTTGVDENGHLVFTFFPNPANDKIRIEGLEGQVEVSICNVMGMVVKTAVLQGDSEIAISDLPSGVYLLRIGRSVARFVRQ